MDILPIPYEPVNNQYNYKQRLIKKNIKIKIKGIRYIKKI